MKTIKEAAKEHGRKVSPQSEWTAWNSEISFKSGVEFAQRWIPVEEELPEIGEKVQVKLLIIGNKTTDVDHDRLILKDGKTWMFDVEQMAGIAVTHWRPIELK